MDQLLGLLLLLLLLALPGRVAAQENRPFAEFFSAADQLDRLAAAAASAGAQPPRIHDPQVAPLFGAITDGRRIFNRSYQVEDLEPLGQVMNRVLGFFLLYTDWGPGGTLSGPARDVRQNRNIALYQDEIVPIVAFAFDSSGQLLRIASSAVATAQPDQRAGFATARTGVSQMTEGLLGVMLLPGVTPDHQLTLAQALDRNAADLAGALTLSQRRSLAMQINIRRGRLGPRARAVMDHVLATFSSSACTGLCAS